MSYLIDRSRRLPASPAACKQSTTPCSLLLSLCVEFGVVKSTVDIWSRCLELLTTKCLFARTRPPALEAYTTLCLKANTVSRLLADSTCNGHETDSNNTTALPLSHPSRLQLIAAGIRGETHNQCSHRMNTKVH